MYKAIKLKNNNFLASTSIVHKRGGGWYYLNNLLDNIDTSITNINNSINKILDKVYPIGSIYLSVNDINPKDLFGGTWVKVVGQYLLAWDCEYGWVGGGWNTHDTVLTIDQIPSHNHPMLANKNAGGQNAGIEHTWGTAYSGYDNNSCGYTGGGQGHHHYFEPPYFKCSVWYRVG